MFIEYSEKSKYTTLARVEIQFICLFYKHLMPLVSDLA